MWLSEHFMELIHSKVWAWGTDVIFNFDVILRWLYNHVLNQHLEHFSILKLPVVTVGGKIAEAINQDMIKVRYRYLPCLYGVYYCHLACFFHRKCRTSPEQGTKKQRRENTGTSY
jgi:hypothetical protein